MSRAGRGVAVVVVSLALVAAWPPAAAQNGSVWLSPNSASPSESAGEVVVTVTMWRAGRVAYQTYDGACTVSYSAAGSPPSVGCSGVARAQAPEDYSAASGELVFTTGGSQTITITVVDDGLVEGNEAFTLAAWEEVNADPWIDRGDSVIVEVADDDDDGDNGSPAAPSGSTTGRAPAMPSAGSAPGSGPAGGQSAGSEAAGPTPTSPEVSIADQAAVSPPKRRDLEVVLPDGDLRPGPGFEISGYVPAERGPSRGGSATPAAIGSGTAALCVGALAVMRRRSRWSARRV